MSLIKDLVFLAADLLQFGKEVGERVAEWQDEKSYKR
jgi:hypothetical protein